MSNRLREMFARVQPYTGTLFNRTVSKEKLKSDVEKLTQKLQAVSEVKETMNTPGWSSINELAKSRLERLSADIIEKSRNGLENELEIARSHGERDGITAWVRSIFIMAESYLEVDTELTKAKKSLENHDLRVESRR